MAEQVERLFGDELRLLAMRPGFTASDVPRLSRFYQRILGFQEVSSFPGFALLRAGGAELAIRHETRVRPTEAYLYVHGVDEALERCLAEEVVIVRPLSTHPWGLRDFVFQDPEGHLVGVGEHLGGAARR